MNYLGNLKKWYFLSRAKNIVIFALTYLSEILALLYEDSGMNSYTVDSDEATQQ
jgi:hypothetical protein